MTQGRNNNCNDPKFVLNISDIMNFEAAADNGEETASKSDTTAPQTSTKDDIKIGNLNKFERWNMYILKYRKWNSYTQNTIFPFRIDLQNGQ